MKWGHESRLIAYSAGNFGKSLLWTTADITLLLLLTDLLGVPPAIAGAIFLAGIACDIIVNIALALLIQKSGLRYAPLIAIGAPMATSFFVLLYCMPHLGIRDTLVIGVVVLLFRACYALVDFPHTALIGQVATESRERSRVAGYRFLFSALAGGLLAWAMPLFMVEGEGVAEHLALVSAIAGGLALVVVGVASEAARRAEGEHGVKPERVGAGDIAAMVAIQPFVVLASIAFVTGLGAPLFAKAFAYYAKYTLMDGAVAQAGVSALVAGQLAGAIGWIWAANRLEKADMLALAHGLIAASLVLLPVAADMNVMVLALTACAGIGLSGAYMTIWGMAPDVADFAAWRVGGRRDAFVFAALIIVMKLSMAIAGAALGVGLALAGYRANLVQDEYTRNVIGIFAFAVPALGSMLCIWLTRQYHLDHAAHRCVAQRLKAAESDKGDYRPNG